MMSAGGIDGNLKAVQIATADAILRGDLATPQPDVSGRKRIVLFAHGSGSSRHSPRNQFVARTLHDSGFGTLLLDLLTEEEERQDVRSRAFRFDIDLLAQRLTSAAEWLHGEPETRDARIGLFGASTGAAAALLCAAERPSLIHAVVSRGGRPDLAGPALRSVAAPTLLIVGGDDVPVIELNRRALAEIAGPKRLEIVAGATHLFEEPGALQQVSRLAGSWFAKYL
jgi:putative phosphoribosyl transferase